MKTALVYVLCAVQWCCCSGYNIPECGSDGTLNVTETHSSITLTCTGITGDIMGWDLYFSNTTGITISQCNGTSSSCRLYNNDWYEVSRTQYSTSTLTVTHTTRDSIAGRVRCVGSVTSTPASCIVRVVPVTKTTTTSTTATKTPSSTAKPPTSTATRDTRATNDDDDDDDGLPIPVIAGGAGGALLVIIAVVIAIVVWKNRCEPTYTRPTRRSQVIDTNIYTELDDPQQQDSIEQAPEEDVYEDTTGQQPAGHGTVEYVNTATGTQAAEGTVYMNV
ncbi:uncharacterized protein [Littorina saxatilis]|uniref:uncharacterized protein n=1 Tax=Littorina saxatilis TaxID=31220 RepID=UPI0038B5BD3E